MSIELNWETLTTGPDGLDLAHKIRDFIHTKFQSVPLPRFIKSVTVHDFEFGAIAPELELKDITDPLPDFYEENSEADDSDDSDDDDFGGEADVDGGGDLPAELRAAAERRRRGGTGGQQAHLPAHIHTGPGGGRDGAGTPHDLGSPFLGVLTPGIPGGTSNLHYFHSQFASGLSGTQTPLAAVASAHHLGPNNGYGGGYEAPSAAQEHRPSFGGVDGQAPSHSRHPSQSSVSFSINDFGGGGSVVGMTPVHPPASASRSGSTAGLPQGGQHPALREKHSVSTLAPTSAGTSRPPTRDASALGGSAIEEDEDDEYGGAGGGMHGGADHGDHKRQRRFREPRVEDIQAVFRIRYAGDVKLLLTADILLDYPMPSFVGIPLRLSITGLTFDGVGVVAYIRKRVHFCFLSPEDAVAAIGADVENEARQEEEGAAENGPAQRPGKLGGLLQEIKVESEIGLREGGKQSLKNVGKVERFVLEQVRRIFEDEFVYPSFWTFLV